MSTCGAKYWSKRVWGLGVELALWAIAGALVSAVLSFFALRVAKQSWREHVTLNELDRIDRELESVAHDLEAARVFVERQYSSSTTPWTVTMLHRAIARRDFLQEQRADICDDSVSDSINARCKRGPFSQRQD